MEEREGKILRALRPGEDYVSIMGKGVPWNNGRTLEPVEAGTRFTYEVNLNEIPWVISDTLIPVAFE